MQIIEHDGQTMEEWRPGVTTRMRISSQTGANQLCVFEQWCDPGLGAPTHLHAVEEILTVLAGEDNPAREGLVSVVVKGVASPDVVTMLNEQGIRTHTRKADHYSGNVLTPLGLPDCIRISFCHYNTEQEIARLLGAIKVLGQDG